MSNRRRYLRSRCRSQVFTITGCFGPGGKYVRDEPCPPVENPCNPLTCSDVVHGSCTGQPGSITFTCLNNDGIDFEYKCIDCQPYFDELYHGGPNPVVFSPLPAGDYHFVVAAKKNGVIIEESDQILVRVTGAPPLTATFTANRDRCVFNALGRVKVTAAGGTPPYTFQITPQAPGIIQTSGGGNIMTFTNIPGGYPSGTTYIVIVRDAAGCFVNHQFTFTKEPELQVSARGSILACGSCTPQGEVHLPQVEIMNIINGERFEREPGEAGDPYYKYLWNIDPNSAIMDSDWLKWDGVNDLDTHQQELLRPGFYTVTVLDARGCRATARVQVVGDALDYTFLLEECGDCLPTCR